MGPIYIIVRMPKILESEVENEVIVIQDGRRSELVVHTSKGAMQGEWKYT